MPRSADSHEYTRLSQVVRASIELYMEDRGITRAQLARDLQVTPGRVTQILSGDESLTLRTLGALAEVLGGHFDVELIPNDALPVPHGHGLPAPRPSPVSVG